MYFVFAFLHQYANIQTSLKTNEENNVSGIYFW